MTGAPFLDWPFFDESHRKLAAGVLDWAERALPEIRIDHADADASCRAIVRRLGEDGWLRFAVGDEANPVGVRNICLVREILARHEGLADFAFAMQGLGSGPISFFGNGEQQTRYLGRVAAGEAIAAFALSEPEAGSDVAAMTTEANACTGGWRLNGTKTWISNGGIADFYIVFARTGGAGSSGISVFIVDAPSDGLDASERIVTIAPHPLATLRFENCFVPAGNLVGQPGQGMRIALGTLDVFRSSVGAAALGFARRAMGLAVGRAANRKLFGAPLAALQMIQEKIADMAVSIDAAALLIYRAAWLKDTTGGRITREAAMAKLFATEEAQRIIDQAVQIFGGAGVVHGNPVESLYREIRALRIYEGASEVQKIIIARQVLADVNHG